MDAYCDDAKVEEMPMLIEIIEKTVSVDSIKSCQDPDRSSLLCIMKFYRSSHDF